LKFDENFEILWKFWNFLKFFEIFEILKFFKNFRVFVNRRWSPSVPNKNYNFRSLKFFENFEILWKFWNPMKILKFFEILKSYENFEIFWNFRNFEILKKISEFSLIDDEVLVFRINIKLLSNPVAELKIRENDSHCRSYSLKNYGPLNIQTTGKGEK
jgi:hypothetical protein